MTHLLPTLPYAPDALAPKMSRETIEYHYGKHLQTYIDNVNKLVAGSPFESMTLDELVVKSDGTLFNNAAQAWNHTLFFEMLTPTPKPIPDALQSALTRDFGSVEAFKEAFAKAAVGLFGSGWVWLVSNGGELEIVAKPNAGNPLTDGLKPLMVLDVWEHAYYIDYRNRRADFVTAYWDLVDWEKVKLG